MVHLSHLANEGAPPFAVFAKGGLFPLCCSEVVFSLSFFSHRFNLDHHARGTASPHLLQNLQEEIARTHRPQQRPPLIAAEGDEMQIPSSVIAFQFARHKEQNPHPFPTPERVGHPHIKILK
jgi:hypothetical protein